MCTELRPLIRSEGAREGGREGGREVREMGGGRRSTVLNSNDPQH